MSETLGGSDEVLRTVHNQRLAHWVIQSIIGETPYSGTAREDEIWYMLHEYQDQNALPGELNADDLYNLFLSNYNGRES